MPDVRCPYCLKLHDGKCTKEDLQEALDFYETKRFHHQMKDGWTADDFITDSELYRNICIIKNLLDESL